MRKHPIRVPFNAAQLSEELVAAGADRATLVVRQHGPASGEYEANDSFAGGDAVLSAHRPQAADRVLTVREADALYVRKPGPVP